MIHSNNYFPAHPMTICYKTQDGTETPSKTNLAKVIVIFRRELYTAESEEIVSYHRYLCNVYSENTQGGNLQIQKYVKYHLKDWYFVEVNTFKSLDSFLNKYLHPSYIEPNYRFAYYKIKAIKKEISAINKAWDMERKSRKIV